MRIAIIEDNFTEAEQLRRQTERLIPASCGLTDIDVFGSGEAFLAADSFYELLLIDCMMPGLTGVELAKAIREKGQASEIIFTTAYMEYAAEGYETEALRYLLKPIEDEKLEEALEAYAKKRDEDPVVEITGTQKRSVFVPASEILYIECVGRKVVVRLENQSVDSLKKIGDFEAEIGTDSFFRAQRQFLVNFRHVMRKHQNTVVMRNGEYVTISRRRVTDFNDAYIAYLRRS